MQCVDDDFCDVGVALFECLEDAYQNRLRFGTLNAAVAVAVFLHHHDTANRALRMVVIKRDIRMGQKYEQLPAMANRCTGQHVGHGRLDDFATFRKVILLNRVHSDFGLIPFGMSSV